MKFKLIGLFLRASFSKFSEVLILSVASNSQICPLCYFVCANKHINNL